MPPEKPTWREYLADFREQHRETSREALLGERDKFVDSLYEHNDGARSAQERGDLDALAEANERRAEAGIALTGVNTLLAERELEQIERDQPQFDIDMDM